MHNKPYSDKDNKKNSKKGNILTYTGEIMDPLHPDPDRIHIEDIAHSLSMLCRANGHFKTFHSVAQHCIECYEEARARDLSDRVRIFCFLHDAAEAYLGDFVSPVKYRMDDYREAEDELLHAVYRKFAGGIPTEEEERLVKEIDHTLLYYEFQALMGQPVGPVPPEPLRSHPGFEEKNWRDVERDYIELFYKITTDYRDQERDMETESANSSSEDGEAAKDNVSNKYTRGNNDAEKKTWIFFDVDDTLYDQRDTFYKVYEEMFAARTDQPADPVYMRSMYYNEQRFDEIQQGIISPFEMIQYRVYHALQDFDIPVSREEAAEFRDKYIEAQSRLSLSPFMEELLDYCSGICGLGIITNGSPDHQGRKIQALALNRWIDENLILVSGAVGTAKPDPVLFREAERRTAAVSARMIYVGDSYDRDMAGARGAGWMGIWMNRRRQPLPEGSPAPDYEVHTEEALADLLHEILPGM